MEDPVISTERLSLEVPGQPSLNNISFEVARGSVFGLIGPRRSGKSALLQILTGGCSHTEGITLVFGESPLHFSDRIRKRIGYCPKSATPYPNLTVRENLNFYASLYGIGLFRRRRVNALLDAFHLNPYKRKLARNMSQERQRTLSLATTMVHDPQLMILDEPASGVSPETSELFWNHFSSLRSLGRTLLISTADVSEAARCDRIGVMTNGRLILSDSPNGLRKQAFGGEMIDIVADSFDIGRHLQPLMELPFIKAKPRLLENGSIRVIVDEATNAIPSLTGWCSERNITIRSLQQFIPGFEATFSKLLQVTNV